MEAKLTHGGPLALAFSQELGQRRQHNGVVRTPLAHRFTLAMRRASGIELPAVKEATG